MAGTTLLEKSEELVAKVQDEALDASRHLAEGIAKEAARLSPPVAEEVTGIVNEVFDFAQRVTEMQRNMLNQVLATISKPTKG